MWFLITLAVVVVGLVVTGYVLYRQLVKRRNYERGLKLVVLQIYLPPVSVDLQSGNRDSREVVDENISKAQVLYNILASVEGKKSRFSRTSQPHFGFEVIANDGRVYFYAIAPTDQAGVIRQAVISAYPTAKVDRVADHNLFNRLGKREGVVGGQVELKKHFSRPIATYLDTKQDTMKSMLQALAGVDQAVGVGIQILVRPADKSWTKAAKGEVSKLKDNSGGNAALGLAAQTITAAWKPPEEGSGNDKGGEPSLSRSDQDLIEAIETKIAQAGFEVLVRIIVSGPGEAISRAVYNNLVASLALFDLPGKNGLKAAQPKSLDKFIAAFNLRFFPPDENELVLNSVELASLFHLPDQANISASQVERQASKQIDGPRDLPDEGLKVGENVYRGVRRPIYMAVPDRRRHTYIVGQTGTGKSVLLENMIAQDIDQGAGLAIVDPHGETIEHILPRIPEHRLDDVIYFNPANMDYPMGLNIFEHDSPDQQDFLIQEAMNMLYKLYDPNRQGMIGARYEYMFRNAAKLVMADPTGGTFIDIPKLFTDQEHVKKKLAHVSDKTVIDFWEKENPASAKSSEHGDMVSWFVSKFSAFLGNDMMRNIIGQNKSTFNLRQVMDEGKILLVNLSKGLTGELNAKLLGMIFVTKFQMAALSRADTDEDQRRDFTLYVDEFQNFATDSFSSILSEARKYRLSLVVANQHTTQLSEEIRDSVLGNVGTAISFRISASDAEPLIKQFYSPTFEVDDLTRLPVGNTIVRTLVRGVPTPPFSMETDPPPPVDRDVKQQVVQQLIVRWGRPRAEVEAEIFDRLGMAPRETPSSSDKKAKPGAEPALDPGWAGLPPDLAGGPMPPYPAYPPMGPMPGVYPPMPPAAGFDDPTQWAGGWEAQPTPMPPGYPPMAPYPGIPPSPYPYPPAGYWPPAGPSPYPQAMPAAPRSTGSELVDGWLAFQQSSAKPPGASKKSPAK